MATYKKNLKTLEVHLMLDGAVKNIADTADDDKATRALNEFKAYGTMHLENNEAVPYHAVQHIKVTETEAEIEKADPYNCVESNCETKDGE